MIEGQHPLASHHVPGFLPGADGSDPLFKVVAVILLVLALSLGNLYLKLHALPERHAHRQHSTQLQLIAVLAILALFTHNNAFWVLALILAVVRLPDFTTPLNSIADSLQRIASSEGESEQNDLSSTAAETLRGDTTTAKIEAETVREDV